MSDLDATTPRVFLARHGEYPEARSRHIPLEHIE